MLTVGSGSFTGVGAGSSTTGGGGGGGVGVVAGVGTVAFFSIIVFDFATRSTSLSALRFALNACSSFLFLLASD